jgi:hypothetical protein
MNDSTGIWVLADVDDNLITTVRTAPGPDAVECSWDKEGRVCGFLTPKQEALFGLLQAGANVVPVTARSTVERVALPFNGSVRAARRCRPGPSAWRVCRAPTNC